MDVMIKDFSVAMQIKTRGVELAVYDRDEFLGDFIVAKSGVIWCRGKKARKNGIKLPWRDFIALMEE